ncbi:MAG: hypothetical protein U0166_26115 [Acidobacteriota bacterium]
MIDLRSRLRGETLFESALSIPSIRPRLSEVGRIFARAMGLVDRKAPTLAPHLPAGFDWRSYLERYDDLRAAGIHDEAGAIEHYLAFGAREGRGFSAPSQPTVIGLSCASHDKVYLRASGALVCWNDVGGDHVLRSFDERTDYGRDVWLGPPFQAIRKKLRAGTLPFPHLCGKCAWLRCGVPSSTYAVDDRVIAHLEIEPTVLCQLECPGCFPQTLRKAIRGSHTLATQVMAKVLADLARASIRVKVIDFQGHGDPLMCRELWSLTRRAREIHPGAYITICTSGNGIVRDGIGSSRASEVVCAIDGVDAASHAPYRVHGNFDRAFGFMTRCVEESRRAGALIRVVWKYVLFEHNSSEEQLLRSQALAAANGIDEIVYVFTRYGPRSKRVTDASQVPVDGRVPVRFSELAPSPANLRAALAAAAAALDAGDSVRAQPLLATVAMNLARHFRTPPDLTPAHRSALGDLERLSARLPPPQEAALRTTIAHLTADSP